MRSCECTCEREGRERESTRERQERDKRETRERQERDKRETRERQEIGRERERRYVISKILTWNLSALSSVGICFVFLGSCSTG